MNADIIQIIVAKKLFVGWKEGMVSWRCERQLKILLSAFWKRQ
jgi:hypothetical protein